LASEIVLAVAAAYNWPEPKRRERTFAPLDAKALKAFTGEYDASFIAYGPKNESVNGPTFQSLW